MSEWLPIKTAPKDGTHVLLRYRWAYKEIYIAEGWWKDSSWHRHGDPLVRAFQWQQLPGTPTPIVD